MPFPAHRGLSVLSLPFTAPSANKRVRWPFSPSRIHCSRGTRAPPGQFCAFTAPFAPGRRRPAARRSRDRRRAAPAKREERRQAKGMGVREAREARRDEIATERAEREARKARRGEAVT
eukprot:2296219-Prymnesium_polylepis.2